MRIQAPYKELKGNNDVRPIPKQLRKLLEEDPFMARCVVGDGNCSVGKPEWEHAFIYAGKQINEAWAIIPVCYFHHRGPGLNKRLNEYVALLRATSEDLAKYPKKDWETLRHWLKKEFGGYKLPKY